MPYSKTTKPMEIARAFLIWLAVASAIFALPGCRSCDRGTRNVQDSDVRGPDPKTDRCATEAPPLEKRQEIAERIRKRRETAHMERQAGSVTIRVYFHILTNSHGNEGDVADADVQSQIDVLNAAFSGAGPGGTGVDTPFRFVLAGIDRTKNDAWFDMPKGLAPSAEEIAAKAALNTGDESTLNIYTARLAGGPYGWTRWPWDFVPGGVDGVVVRYSTLPGGGSYPFNLGDVVTHEVGHWLGLFHTFEGGCYNPGDSVADTSPEKYPARDCPVSRNTCEGGFNDPVENFMDYTTDACMYRFTRGQSDRMDAIHLEFRTPP